ncbi:hypothetical protein LUZ60_016608 [Juncus effusus]|nr:hypothetical protein LUZ60_016608 [Juncus effusus]
MASTSSSSSSSSSSSPAIPIQMLTIPEKKPYSTDLHRPLRDHIAATFSPEAASSSERELNLIRQMRSDLERQTSSFSPESRLDLLQSYYRALSVIDRRLGRVSSVPFTWYDAFRSNRKSSYKSVEFEKGAVLFNIGAVHAQIGAGADRTTVDGRKLAYSEFQKAADAFRLLKENAITGMTVDLTVECASMLEKLMLAQAQKCMFDKVISDSKGPLLCSKVAKQAGNFYTEAFISLTSSPLDQHFERSWISHVQLKSAYFYSQSVHLYCTNLHEKEEIGEEIARLKLASSMLSDAKRSAKYAPSSLLDATSKLEFIMKQSLEKAIKENNQVYLMRVPPVSSLSELQGAVLAQHISISDSLDISDETIFSNLIPDSSKKILGKYTNMVDDIIMVQMDKIQQERETIKAKLQELGLPDSIHMIENGLKFPIELRTDAEAIQEGGGPGGLEMELNQLKDLRRVNINLIAQIEEMLSKEERDDSKYRAEYKDKWDRLKSTELTKNIRERLSKYNINIKEAGISDARIEQSLRESHALMAILDYAPIESVLPSIVRPVVYLDGTQDRTIASLKQSLSQLESVEAQLAKLEEKLKETKAKDDILPKLLAGISSEEDLFSKEIGKYNPICEEISINIQSHKELLLQIQEQNHEFASSYKTAEYKVSYERCVEQIHTAIAKFREIKENMSEGIKFYVTLQDALNNLKQQSSDFAMTRNIQCSEMANNLKSRHGWRLFGHHSYFLCRERYFP